MEFSSEYTGLYDEDNLNKNGDTVILALESNEFAEFAVHWYIEKLHKSGNKLVFVYCIDLPAATLSELRQTQMSPDKASVLASTWREKNSKELECKIRMILKERLNDEDLQCYYLMRTIAGKPGKIICEAAEEENADMIVIGQRESSKMQRVIRGSVSDYLIRHAHCPVIVCHDPHSAKKRKKTISFKSPRESIDLRNSDGFYRSFGSLDYDDENLFEPTLTSSKTTLIR